MKKLLYVRSALTHTLTLHTQKDPAFLNLIINIISECVGDTLINTTLHVRVWIVQSLLILQTLLNV